MIRSFDERHSEQTLTDVAKTTGLDRAAARRFLLTLEQLGYVEHDGKVFRLAPQILQLGYAYLSSLPWWHHAQRVGERLTAQIGVATAVGVLDGPDVVYVAYASAGRFPLLANRSVGTHLPAVTSAVGRVLIAAMAKPDERNWLSGVKLERFTPLTRTSRADVERALDAVRQSGYSIVDQELEIGLRSLGVPIRNRRGGVIAGLSISILESRLSSEAIVKKYLPPLQEAADEITAGLPT